MSAFYHRLRIACAPVVLSFLLAQLAVAASSGSITGRVVDKSTGDPLPGANVTIQGTSIGASTDLDGKYTLRIVPTGHQSIRVTYVGYLTVTVDVTVAEEAALTQDFRLIAQAIQGETVIVTGQAKGQMAAINQQLSSNSIINVVSADKMKELPDANIAESIGRLPGISLQRNAGEAYAVVVRGLSPKYNEVTIEGVPMTSTNYYDRSIDLSLLSDDLVRSVEVSKTLQPNMDADALGGTINLTLKSADPGFHYNAMGFGAYNNLRNSYNNYKFSGSVSDRFLDDKVGVLLQGNIEQKQLPSDQFSGGYATPALDPSNQWYVVTNSATLTETNLNRHRYGASAVLDYASDFVDLRLFTVYDQKRDSTLTRTDQSDFTTNDFKYNIYATVTTTEQSTNSLGALFKPWGTELPVSISYTRSDQRIPSGQEFDFLQTGTVTVNQNFLKYAQPLDAIHIQGVMDPSVSTLWNLFVSNTLLTDESYDAKLDWKIPFKISDAFSGRLSLGGKYHEVTRTSESARWYFDVQFGGSKGRRQELIAGFPFLRGSNDALEAGLQAYPFLDPSFTRTNILGYPIGPGYDIHRLNYMMNAIFPAWYSSFYNDGPGTYNQDYNDKEHTAAGYVMGEFNIGDNLTVVPGVRYQDEVTEISAYQMQLNGSNQNGLSGPPPVLVDSKRNTPGWYPSVNIKYKVNENIHVLGAAFRSISLPSYGDVTPLLEYSGPAFPTVVTGNPLLRPSSAWNFDLGATFSNNDIGLVTVNLFYKEISDLIYSMQSFTPFYPYPLVGAPSDIFDRLPGPQSGYFDTLWAKANSAQNVQATIPMNDPAKAYLRGIEISWQTHLWYLPGVLSGVVLDLNASYMSSQQQYPSFNLVQTGGTFLRKIYALYYQTISGPLQDQPKATYNAILGWDYSGFSSRFSLRYQKLTLSSFDNQYGLRDAYFDNVLIVDISLKQQIIGKLYVFANATNVNGHIDASYYSHPAYNNVAAGQLPTGNQTYGWAAQVGLNFSF